MMLHLRADKAKHHEVNDTLSNLGQNWDLNPYISEYKDSVKAHPTLGIDLVKPLGWERKGVI